MKCKTVIDRLVLAFVLLFCLPMQVQSEEPAKALIIVIEGRSTGNVIETQPDGQSQIIHINPPQAQASSSTDAVTLETLMAQRLMNADFQVITGNELAPSPWLTQQDIADARAGDISKARKAAALNDANLILKGQIKTQLSWEDMIGMDMKKAVAVSTMSYGIYETASGKRLHMGSKQHRYAKRTPDAAKYACFERLAAEIARDLSDKDLAQASSQDVALLKKYKGTFQKKTVSTTPSAATKTSSKEQSRPTSPGPQIIIVNPPMARGFEVVESKARIAIEGYAKDRTGIAFVKINTQSIDFDAEGHFLHEVNLSPGENRFSVVAENKVGIMNTKDIVIKHGKDTLPPKIVLVKPEAGRGFSVEAVGLDPVTQVEGIVTDASGVQYVKVNGQARALDMEGHFSGEVLLRGDEAKIVIEACDQAGNKAKKEFLIAKGSGNTRILMSDTGDELKPTLWGLAIGVSQYESTAVDLKYADNDALSLARFLEKQEGRLFSEVYFKTLVNEAVTRESVIESISSHLGKAAPDDVVFIFLAGHGIKHSQSGSYYFVPYNADAQSILSKGLRMSDFQEAVNILSKNVNKVILAMDTCHSGAMQMGARFGGSGENLAEALREASGIVILAASKAGEESLEDKAFKLHKKDPGHGAFTFVLIEGMSGKANYDGDHYISSNELFQYVARQVPRLTQGRQHPYFRTEGTDIPLILLEQ